ncbi:MAG: lysophospholipid acyltransferase family protein [Isosphaeraceae bacterium]
MTEPGQTATSPANPQPAASSRADGPGRDRSLGALLWFRLAQGILASLFAAVGGWRATGQSNIPKAGGTLLVANHNSFLDSFLVGIPLRRPMNFVARSTLFMIPVIGFLIRSLGGFPIQREGMGASGLKETLRRLRNGGIITFFPEGTRSPDGELGPLKPGIAVLVSRARVPVVPAGIAGTFQAWPRTRLLPVPHPLRIHYGPPITPEELAGLDAASVTEVIRQRLEQAMARAREGLARDLSA